MSEMFALLITMREHHASDLHLSVGASPMLRIHGELQATDMGPLTPDTARALIEQVMTPEQRKRWHAEYELDFSYELSDVARFRVNAFLQRQGPAAVFRQIPFEIKTVSELELPDPIVKFADAKQGLFLVTGATGSGKSTTLAALIDYINTKRRDHIVTIEDPIEFVHHNKGCLVNQREVGVHTKSFANALRSALREDPNVILVGELRDLETIELALTAAETGHLVMATLHTNSAADSIDRIINVFPTNQQPQIRQVLSNALIGIVAQNLLRRSDKPGRVAATEILIMTTGIANLIREGKSFQIHSVLQTSRKDGMQSMDQSLQDLLAQHKISRDEALIYAREPQLFPA